MSARVLPQWVDGEVDVKVELQALGFGVCVFYLGGNVLCPQFKEHFVVSVIKRAQEVFLQKSELKTNPSAGTICITHHTMTIILRRNDNVKTG